MALILSALLVGMALSWRGNVLRLAAVLILAGVSIALLGLLHALPDWFSPAFGLMLLALAQVGYALGVLRFALLRPEPMPRGI